MIFFVSLAISLGLLFAAYRSARRADGLGRAGGIGLIGLLFVVPVPFCCIVPAVGMSGLLIALSALVCGLIGAGSRAFLNCGLVAVLGSHVLVGFYSLSVITERMDLRDRYPVESLEERLAYENQGPAGVENKQQDKARTTSQSADSPADKRLEELEYRVYKRTKLPRRKWGLMGLHESMVQDFIEAPGFGIGRKILDPKAQYIDLPQVEPIPFPPPEYERSDSQSPQAQASPPPQDKLWEMHAEGVADFANPEGFGFIRDRRHVKGFEPHRFSAMPEVDKEATGEMRRWRVQSLELVSLLKHPESVACLSRHLPRMDELREAPTRPLKDFELKALATLRSREDIYFESDDFEIRMLGSIRAVKDCTSCHRVKGGDLLGAFSYSLRCQIAK